MEDYPSQSLVDTSKELSNAQLDELMDQITYGDMQLEPLSSPHMSTDLASQRPDTALLLSIDASGIHTEDISISEKSTINKDSPGHPEYLNHALSSPDAMQTTNVAALRGKRRQTRTEEERIEEFRSDTQVADFEAYRVKCAFCDKWIKLRPNSKYCPIPWRCHKLACTARKEPQVPPVPLAGASPPPAQPSLSNKLNRQPRNNSGLNRRSEEERIQFLLDDPYAEAIEPHRVLCNLCKKYIKLRHNSTYCSAPWTQHITKCKIRQTQTRIADHDETASGNSHSDDSGHESRDEELWTTQNDSEARTRKPGRSRGSGGVSPVRQRGNRRRSQSSSPSRPHPPAPPSAHPYPDDLYWFPSIPPPSAYYQYYTESQYFPEDDSYCLYFLTPRSGSPPPASSSKAQDVHDACAPSRSGQNPAPRPVIPSSLSQNPTRDASEPAIDPEISTTASNSAISDPTQDSTPSKINMLTLPRASHEDPRPDQRGWIVWKLRSYADNICPEDVPRNTNAPPHEIHGSFPPRQNSYPPSFPPPLPLSPVLSRPPPMPTPTNPSMMNSMYQYPHLYSPTQLDPPHQSNVPWHPPQPYTSRPPPPPEVPPPRWNPPHRFQRSTFQQYQHPSHSSDIPPPQYPGAHPALRQPRTKYPPILPVPRKSLALARGRTDVPPNHIRPPHIGEYGPSSPSPSSPSQSSSSAPRGPTDPNLSNPQTDAHIPPASISDDLASPDVRLAFVFQSIAYLFGTSYQGAGDISLESLMDFMNGGLPPDKQFHAEEVRAFVATLGERKQLIFRDGTLHMLSPP